MIQVLRLSDTYQLSRAALQNWIRDVVSTVGALVSTSLVSFTYTQGVSPSPFPVSLAGRPRAVLLGGCIDQVTPSTAVAATISWAYTPAGVSVIFAGLTSGRAYDVTLCVLG